MNAPPSSSKPTIWSTRSRRSSKSAPNSPSNRLDLSARFTFNKSIYRQGVPRGRPFVLVNSLPFYRSTTWRVHIGAAPLTNRPCHPPNGYEKAEIGKGRSGRHQYFFVSSGPTRASKLQR